MRNILLTTMTALTLAMVSNIAMAQEAEEPNVVYQSRTEIDFEGVSVDGELVKPQGAFLLDRKRASFNPLIKLRLDFDDEMSQSVDEVK